MKSTTKGFVYGYFLIMVFFFLFFWWARKEKDRKVKQTWITHGAGVETPQEAQSATASHSASDPAVRMGKSLRLTGGGLYPARPFRASGGGRAFRPPVRHAEEARGSSARASAGDRIGFGLG